MSGNKNSCNKYLEGLAAAAVRVKVEEDLRVLYDENRTAERKRDHQLTLVREAERAVVTG